ncbi:hypothetical protein AAC387_Pa04g1716 [Persea americana]
MKKTANDTHKIKKQNRKFHKHKPPIPHLKFKTKQKPENADHIRTLSRDFDHLMVGSVIGRLIHVFYGANCQLYRSSISCSGEGKTLCASNKSYESEMGSGLFFGLWILGERFEGRKWGFAMRRDDGISVIFSQQWCRIRSENKEGLERWRGGMVAEVS